MAAGRALCACCDRWPLPPGNTTFLWEPDHPIRYSPEQLRCLPTEEAIELVMGHPVTREDFMAIVRSDNAERFEDVYDRLRRGESLYPPVIVESAAGDTTSTDGAHRIAAALALGISQVPVVVVRR